MPNISKHAQIWGLVIWFLLSFAAAYTGSVASRGAGSFYQELELPAWAPPGSIFGPVWSLLYTLMACAAWLVWRRDGFGGAALALSLYLAQLAANALWSWLFFAWKNGPLAFAEILMLWALIVATILSFWRKSPLAGALLLPYLAWVSFAAALAFTAWRMNPALLG